MPFEIPLLERDARFEPFDGDMPPPPPPVRPRRSEPPPRRPAGADDNDPFWDWICRAVVWLVDCFVEGLAAYATAMHPGFDLAIAEEPESEAWPADVPLTLDDHLLRDIGIARDPILGIADHEYYRS